MKLSLTPLFLSHSTSNLSRNPIGSIFSLHIHTLILLITYTDTTLIHVSIRFHLEYCNYLLGTSLLLHLAPCILVSIHQPYDTFQCASQIMPLLCLQYFNGSPPNSENTKSLQRSVRPYMTSPIPPPNFWSLNYSDLDIMASFLSPLAVPSAWNAFSWYPPVAPTLKGLLSDASSNNFI